MTPTPYLSSQEKAKWEEEFDKEFFDSNLGWVSLHDTSPDAVKDFIRKTLQSDRISFATRVKEEMEKMKNTPFPRMGYTGEKAVREQALSDSQQIINNLLK